MTPDTESRLVQPVARSRAELQGRAVIFDSWRRSSAAGRERSSAPQFRRVSDDELSQRMASNADLLAVAAPHVKRLSAMLNVPHVVYVTDAEGIVLDSRGDPDIMSRFSLSPGYDWCEARMGTNGAGTALACGAPVAVIGPEHFSAEFQDCTCTAAPIRGSNGRIVGAIDVSSGVGHGSAERVLLVAYVAEQIERELAYRCEKRQFSELWRTPKEDGPRVLIIEDNPDLRSLLEHSLAAEGFEVKTASNGTEALRLLHNCPVEIVVTDIFMPDEDGIEVISELKQSHPGMKIIAMSGGPRGHGQVDYLTVARQVGADGALGKPFTPSQLVDLLQTLVRTRHMSPPDTDCAS